LSPDLPLYTPPRPNPLWAVAGLVRTALGGEGNLLSLLPAAAYKMRVGTLGWSRRMILIVNAPDLLRGILTDPSDIYPKNDLMVGALAPLVGESMFVSSGDTWRQQRRMIDPAFSHMRLNRAFTPMTAAVDDYVIHLDDLAARKEPFSLDLAMSHLTADIICRTVFSTSLRSDIAREVFDDFTIFERSVAHVELKRLIFDPPWSNIPHHEAVLAACERIREHLGQLVDDHLEPGGKSINDIASAIIAARDLETGATFTRKELIDQLGVFFLAGHETTASALTWAFFILSQQPEAVARIRYEVAQVCGDGPVEFEHIKRLTFTRNVFRETLRLYPPITFIPRVAAETTRIGKYKVKKGAMIMIAPWTIHRHAAYWKSPHAFDPDRFSAEREHELIAGAYLPFGWGPRVCVGASFATTESALILARLIQRYHFSVEAPDKVRPVARLTTRPAEQILCRVARQPSS
jgi:cytochrome P450